MQPQKGYPRLQNLMLGNVVFATKALSQKLLVRLLVGYASSQQVDFRYHSKPTEVMERLG